MEYETVDIFFFDVRYFVVRRLGLFICVVSAALL